MPLGPEQSLGRVLERIDNPWEWAEPRRLIELLQEGPYVRGPLYGLLAAAQLDRWLEERDVPVQTPAGDGTKARSDRTILYKARCHTIRVRSMQTARIRQTGPGTFVGRVRCDGGERRKVMLPNGHRVQTTNCLAGEFTVLATPLHPFTGAWDFAFRLNDTLPRTISKRFAPEDRPHLLKALVPVSWPLVDPWSADLLGLLDNVSAGPRRHS